MIKTSPKPNGLEAFGAASDVADAIEDVILDTILLTLADGVGKADILLEAMAVGTTLVNDTLAGILADIHQTFQRYSFLLNRNRMNKNERKKEKKEINA